MRAFQCPLCGAFCKRADFGTCGRCGVEWDNRPGGQDNADGTDGQDRESYTDDQDRANYSVDEDNDD